MQLKQILFCFIGLSVIITGCEPQLETGYKPRPLNSTEADRRAFYAPAFTPEAHPPKETGGPSFDAEH